MVQVVRKTREGTVVSDKMDKTAVVAVMSSTRHRLYKKIMRRLRRYMVHDETNDAKLGDRVRIVESRPHSRRKRWKLAEVLVRADRPEVAAEEIDLELLGEVKAEEEEPEAKEVPEAEAAAEPEGEEAPVAVEEAKAEAEEPQEAAEKAEELPEAEEQTPEPGAKDEAVEPQEAAEKAEELPEAEEQTPEPEGGEALEAAEPEAEGEKEDGSS